jgi:elongation factor Ts
MAPLYLSASEIPADSKAKQGDIFKAQLAEDPKAPPAASHPKIIEGKLAKWAKEICLLDQQSVLDGNSTVDQTRAAVAKELGAEVVFSRFVRFERGEGIEKPTGDDFASEVAKMAGG